MTIRGRKKSFVNSFKTKKAKSELYSPKKSGVYNENSSDYLNDSIKHKRLTNEDGNESDETNENGILFTTKDKCDNNNDNSNTIKETGSNKGITGIYPSSLKLTECSHGTIKMSEIYLDTIYSCPSTETLCTILTSGSCLSLQTLGSTDGC